MQPPCYHLAAASSRWCTRGPMNPANHSNSTTLAEFIALLQWLCTISLMYTFGHYEGLSVPLGSSAVSIPFFISSIWHPPSLPLTPPPLPRGSPSLEPPNILVMIRPSVLLKADVIALPDAAGPAKVCLTRHPMMIRPIRHTPALLCGRSTQ